MSSPKVVLYLLILISYLQGLPIGVCLFVACAQRDCRVFDGCHGFVVDSLFQYTQLPEMEVGCEFHSPCSNLGEP